MHILWESRFPRSRLPKLAQGLPRDPVKISLIHESGTSSEHPGDGPGAGAGTLGTARLQMTGGRWGKGTEWP